MSLTRCGAVKRSFSARAGVMPMANMAMSQRLAVTSSTSVAKELFTNFRDNPVVERIFKGIRPVVVSLIAVPMINMARKNNKTWWAWAISAVTLFLVAFLSFSPVYILLVLIVVSAGIAVIRDKKEVRND